MADTELADYNGSELFGTALTFLVVTWTAMGLRAYTRALLLRNFQMDDWAMLAGQIINTLFLGFIFAGLSKGIGYHNASIALDDARILALKWQALATAFYILTMLFVKLSIGILLLRLTAGASTQRTYWWIVMIATAANTLWMSALFSWSILQCHPIAAQWDYRLQGSTCVSIKEVVDAAYALSALSVLSDFLFAILPIPMLWKIQMTTQAKMTVILLLSLGLFASVATLVRIHHLKEIEDLGDVLYAGTNAMIWTILEPGLSILASCLATIRPLLSRMRIHGFRTLGSSVEHDSRPAYQPTSMEPKPGHEEMPLEQLQRRKSGGISDSTYATAEGSRMPWASQTSCTNDGKGDDVSQGMHGKQREERRPSSEIMGLRDVDAEYRVARTC